jgi:hypothetical protein
MLPLFFVNFLLFPFIRIHSIDSSVAIAELHSITAVPSVEGFHWGAEPRIELGTALQQPHVIPSELCHTLKHTYHVPIYGLLYTFFIPKQEEHCNKMA